jgi:hypothetical protein
MVPTKMLDMMAEGENSVTLKIAREQFEGADVLTLTEKCDQYIGGGYYIMNHYEGREINRTMWLCQVTEFVFGDIPPLNFCKERKPIDN